MKNKKLHSILGLIISCVLLIWVIKIADWREVGETLSQIQILYIIPILIIFLIHNVLRAIRWKYLLPETTETTSLRILFDSIVGGGVASLFLPLRAGEIIRPYLLSRFSSQTFSASLASVVVERFFDLSAVLTSFALMAVFIPDMPNVLFAAAGVLGSIAAVLLVFISIGTFFPAQILKLIAIVLKFFPEAICEKLTHFAEEVLAGASVFRHGARLLYVVVLTSVIWGSSFVFYYLSLLLCAVPTSWGLAIGLSVILSLAAALPSAPGFVGVYQYACVLTFGLFGISTNPAVAFSIVTHVNGYALLIIFGLVVVWQRGWSFVALRDIKPENLD